MQNKPSHNLLDAGVNPDKKKKQNQYLFCDNVVLLNEMATVPKKIVRYWCTSSKETLTSDQI